MDDKKKNDPAVGLGLLSVIGGLGGAMVRGRIGEWEHTFCEDCNEWRPNHGGLCASMFAHHAPDPVDKSWGPLAVPQGGPLWPGCRGFSLRAGCPGPAKRYHDAVKRGPKESETCPAVPPGKAGGT